MDSSSRYVHDKTFYRVFDEKGQQYADCGLEKHAQDLIELNKDVQQLTYKKIDPPQSHSTESQAQLFQHIIF